MADLAWPPLSEAECGPKRLTASEARRDWYQLLDGIVAGDTVVIEWNGVHIILCRETDSERTNREVPRYDDVISVLDADQADRWGWEREENGLRSRESDD